MFRRYPRLTGALVGLAVMTASLTLLFDTEFGRRLEFLAFDLRVRHCNALQPASPILHVDIDDNALVRVRRWPWHRDELGHVVRALHELGARDILIDLLLNEPEEPYLQNPADSKYDDSDVAMVSEIAEANRVYPDLELAAAMRDAGNVVLAIHMIEPQAATDKKEILRRRAQNKLLSNFTLTDQDLARELGEAPANVSAIMARAKSDAAGRLVQNLVRDGRPPTREEAFAAILGARKDTINADRIDVEKALFTARGLAAAAKTWPRATDAIAGRVRTFSGAVPPCQVLADSVATVAVVNFFPDLDGYDRRVPLIMKYQDRCVVHMGLAGAARILNLQLDQMRLSADNVLVIPAAGGSGVTIPLDPDGNMIINWAATAPEWKKDKDFPHITAAKLYEMIDARMIIEQNRTLRDLRLAEVVAASKGQVTLATSGPSAVLHADNVFRGKVNDRLELERRIRLAHLRRDARSELPAWEKQSAQLQEEILRDQRQAIAAVTLAGRELAAIPPDELAKDVAAQADVKRFGPALAIIEKEIPAIDEANRGLEATVESARAALAEKIRGKHVFFGYAATAEGDIVPTPIDHRTNGVMCHSHVLNSILQHRYITPASRTTEAIVAMCLGAFVSVVTATRGPRAALVATVALMIGYSIIDCYVFFMRAGIWFALAAPLITFFVTWAFVTLFRQFTAEREKRLFAKQLSQYTSPVIAARIAEDPQAIALFKTVQTRDMSFYFSDLAGFTTLSEQENPEVIQHVLNIYLARMSAVIWARRGLINKFMGDGIMAFFNPSVDPLDDHARIACETSLQTIEELERIKSDFAADPAARIFGKLGMRIGLSTGTCKNGDLGSELKADYTAIGDVVNLAARLEPANKVFGTQILVSSKVREAARNDFEFRYLAELQVKGKADTVPVYELIGRKGVLSDEQRQYVERFEAGVELYKQRKWDECIVHFTRILSRRFDDLGASRYVDACQEFKRFPPEDNWIGALELKEK